MLQRFPSRLLLFGCALLLLLTGCETIDEPPPVPARTEQAMALMPADARFVGMVDLQDLQQNGGIAFSSERGVTVRFLDSDVTFNPLSAEEQARLQAFIDATGFEPGTDVHAAYVAGDSLRPRAFLLAANVDRDRLTKQMLAEFGNRIDTASYRNTPIVQLQPSETDADLQFALMPDGWIALADETPTLHAMIDRSLTTALADNAMTELVSQVGGRGGAWIALRNLPSQRMARSADERRMRQVAQAVRDVATALNFEGDGVTGKILLTTDQNASDLADVVRGLVSGVKMNQELTEEQRRFLDRVTVTAQSGQVWIDFEIDQETLARLLIQSMRSGGGTNRVAVR